MPLSEKQKQYQKEYYIKNREARLAASLERQKKFKLEKSQYDKIRRLLKGEEIREYDKIRSKFYSSRINQIVNRAKARAKKYNLNFDLSSKDIVIPEFCPILGIKLNWSDTHGGKFDSPSLDRIIPSKGYVKGNVQVISKRANSIKSDASAKELMLVYQWVASQIEGQQELVHLSTENAPSL
jgi:hypothetical protein